MRIVCCFAELCNFPKNVVGALARSDSLDLIVNDVNVLMQLPMKMSLITKPERSTPTTTGKLFPSSDLWASGTLVVVDSSSGRPCAGRAAGDTHDAAVGLR